MAKEGKKNQKISDNAPVSLVFSPVGTRTALAGCRQRNTLTKRRKTIAKFVGSAPGKADSLLFFPIAFKKCRGTADADPVTGKMTAIDHSRGGAIAWRQVVEKPILGVGHGLVPVFCAPDGSQLLVSRSLAAPTSVGEIANRYTCLLQLVDLAVQFLAMGAGSIGKHVQYRPGFALCSKYDQVGAFTQSEFDFIERIIFTNAWTLGFYRDKVVTRLSSTIARKDVVEIAGSGHCLFKGLASDTYRRIRKDVGESIVLTSGIRGIVKQIFLLLKKASEVNGNLSLASYSLAPAGHAYRARGDFDVGKNGWGHKKFSADFAATDEFRRLVDLGYLDIRYPQDNPFGVCYEPRHVKLV